MILAACNLRLSVVDSNEASIHVRQSNDSKGQRGAKLELNDDSANSGPPSFLSLLRLATRGARDSKQERQFKTTTTTLIHEWSQME